MEKSNFLMKFFVIVTCCFLLISHNIFSMQTTLLRSINEVSEIRAEGNFNSKVLEVAPQGAVLEAIGKKGEWYIVSLTKENNGYQLSGYVHSSEVELLTEFVKEIKIAGEDEKNIQEQITMANTSIFNPVKPSINREEPDQQNLSLKMITSSNTEIGFNVNYGVLPEVNINVNDYSDYGGYTDNYGSSWEVTDINSSWDVKSGNQLGLSGYLIYRFTNSFAGKLNFSYGSVKSIESTAKLKYSVYDEDDHRTYNFTRNDFSSCDEQGSLQTIKLNPCLQFAFLNKPRGNLAISMGPSVFLDNFKGYFSLPVIFTYIEYPYIYLSSGQTKDPVKYTSKKASLGLSGTLNGSINITNTFFLEGGFNMDFGGVPIFNSDDNDMTSEQPFVDLDHLTINNDTDSKIRSYGFNFGMGFRF